MSRGSLSAKEVLKILRDDTQEVVPRVEEHCAIGHIPP